jgi:hypothetical protein
MNTKKSGLADSPFFAKPTPPPSPPTASGQQSAPEMHVGQQLYERANAQPRENTDAQMHKGTDARTPERADAQTHKRTDTQNPRRLTRESFDIYEDQAQAIEEMRLRLRRERGRHVTKGEVMRELLETALAAKK